jgi:hypothetical protein
VGASSIHKRLEPSLTQVRSAHPYIVNFTQQQLEAAPADTFGGLTGNGGSNYRNRTFAVAAQSMLRWELTGSKRECANEATRNAVPGRRLRS